jgi:hypothetical protein
MLDRVKDTFDLHPERIIADTAYGSGPMLGWLVDRKIAPHIPVIDKAGRTDGTWSRADFEWDPENDQYVCLEGQSLKQFRRNYSDPNRGPDGKGVAKYRALKLTCQACPSKAKCCPNADFRSITREEHEDARQVARDIAKPNNMSSRCGSERRWKCSLPTSNAFSGWGGSDYVAHAAQMTNSSSPQLPKTSAN